MVWQDVLISICTLLLAYSLIPQVLKGIKEKKPLVAKQTSILSALGACGLALAFFTLGFWYSAGMNFATAVLWTTLLFQSFRYSE